MRRIIIIAVAILCMAALPSSAQTSRYDAEGNRVNAAGHKINKYNVECEPDYYSTTEYFGIRINWQGAVRTAGGMAYERHATKFLLRLRTNKDVKSAAWVVNEGGTLVYEPVAFQSFVAVDLVDGTKKGFFTVECKMTDIGDGLPDAYVRICGELKLRWNEGRQHWETASGDGYAVGIREGGLVDSVTEDASWCPPSKTVLPLRGTVLITPHPYLTDAQQKNLAPKRSKP